MRLRILVVLSVMLAVAGTARAQYTPIPNYGISGRGGSTKPPPGKTAGEAMTDAINAKLNGTSGEIDPLLGNNTKIKNALPNKCVVTTATGISTTDCGSGGGGGGADSTEIITPDAAPWNAANDGVTDDYAALAAARDAGCGQHKRILRLLPGKGYAISRPINLAGKWCGDPGGGGAWALYCDAPSTSAPCRITNRDYFGPVVGYWATNTNYPSGQQFTSVDYGPPLVSGSVHSWSTRMSDQSHHLDLRDAPTVELDGLTQFTAQLWYKQTAPGAEVNNIIASAGGLSGWAGSRALPKWGDNVAFMLRTGQEDGISRPDAAMASGSNVIHSDTANFTQFSIVGRAVTLTGSFTGSPYTGTVTSVTDAQNIVVSFTNTSGVGISGATVSVAAANARPLASFTTANNGRLNFAAAEYFPLNTAHHLALSYDGSFVRMYVDGREEARVAASGPMVQTKWERVYVGHLPIEGWPYGAPFIAAMPGYIDGVELAKTARYVADCGTIPCQAFSPPSSQPVVNSDSLIVANFDEDVDQVFTRTDTGLMSPSKGYLFAYAGGNFTDAGVLQDVDLSGNGSRGLFDWLAVQLHVSNLWCLGCDAEMTIASSGIYQHVISRVFGSAGNPSGARRSGDWGVVVRGNDWFLNQVQLNYWDVPMILNGPGTTSDVFLQVSADNVLFPIMLWNGLQSITGLHIDAEDGSMAARMIGGIYVGGNDAENRKVAIQGDLISNNPGPNMLGTIVVDGGGTISIHDSTILPLHSGTNRSPAMFVNYPPNHGIQMRGNEITGDVPLADQFGMAYIDSDDRFVPMNKRGGGATWSRLGPPPAPQVTINTAGSATHTYYVVYHDLAGHHTMPSPGTTVNNSSTPPNNRICEPSNSASGDTSQLGSNGYFDVLRDGITGAVIIGTTDGQGGCVADVGQAARAVRGAAVMRAQSDMIAPSGCGICSGPNPLTFVASSLPAAQVGDEIIFALQCHTYPPDGPTVGSPDPFSTPSGWTKLGETWNTTTNAGNHVGLFAMRVESLPLSDMNISVWQSGARGICAAKAISYVNLDPANPIDGIAFAETGPAKAHVGNIPSVTPTDYDDVLLVGAAWGDTDTFAAAKISIAGAPMPTRFLPEGQGNTFFQLWGLGLGDSTAPTTQYGLSADWGGTPFDASITSFALLLRAATINNPWTRDETADVATDGAFLPNIQPSDPIVGPDAGSITCSQPFGGTSYKKVLCRLDGYQNAGTGAQQFAFEIPFAHTPFAAHDDSGGVTLAPDHVTFPTSMATPKSGWVEIEGN